MPQTQFLHGIRDKLLHVESVKRNVRIWEALQYYLMHTLGEVHRYFSYLGAQIPVNLHQRIYDILHSGAADDGYKGTLATMSVLVGDDGVEITIREGSLVNAEVRTDVFGKYEPLLSMLLVLPSAEVAQMILVSTLELVALDVIWFLERSGRNRGCIQGILLKKSQTP